MDMSWRQLQDKMSMDTAEEHFELALQELDDTVVGLYSAVVNLHNVRPDLFWLTWAWLRRN